MCYSLYGYIEEKQYAYPATLRNQNEASKLMEAIWPDAKKNGFTSMEVIEDSTGFIVGYIRPKK